MGLKRLERRIRRLLLFFIAALLLSGVTAFPLQEELALLDRLFGPASAAAGSWPALSAWIHRVYTGLSETYRSYPFIAYGTDWLAFAHIVIAIAFLDPVVLAADRLFFWHFGDNPALACAGCHLGDAHPRRTVNGVTTR
jgi:hypothetical protein